MVGSHIHEDLNMFALNDKCNSKMAKNRRTNAVLRIKALILYICITYSSHIHNIELDIKEQV